MIQSTIYTHLHTLVRVVSMTYKYSPHQMLLRQEALKILLGQFGAKNNEKGMPNIKVTSYMSVPNSGLHQVI